MRETLYQDDYEPVTIITDEDDKRYQIDGVEKISVTRILNIKNKEGLREFEMKQALQYAKKRLKNHVGKELTVELLEDVFSKAPLQAEKKRAKAAEIGTRVHNWIENYTPGTPVPQEKGWKAVEWACRSYLKYRKENPMHIIHSEKPLYSKEWDVCGSLDEYSGKYDKKYLVDFKTSTNFFAEMPVQELMYADFLNEETGEETDFLRTVKLNKAGVGYEILDVGQEHFAGIRAASRGALLLTEGMDYIEEQILEPLDREEPIGYEVDMGGVTMRIEDV